MPPSIIAILIFIAIFTVLAIFMRIKWKGAYLDKLELLPGERVLFNDEKCRVELKAAPRVDILPGSFVRITDQRIVIAQKVLGRETYIMKYIINYTGLAAPEGVGGGSLKTGYITYRTMPQKIFFKTDKKERPFVRIEPFNDSGMGIPYWLHIYTDKVDDYRRILGG